MDARTQAAVFTIGRGLGRVQPFTSEKEPLLAAIAVATSGKDLKARSLTAQAQQASRDALGGGQSPEFEDASQPSRELIAAGPGRPPGVPQDRRGPDFLNWIARALRMADGLQRQMEGEWSLYPLLALVKAQAPLAGRKTLIFFSSGLQVPPNLQDVFRTVVSEANRSNVSVYSVDARGLRTRGDISTSGAALREAATTSMAQQMKAASDPTTIQEMQIMDTAQDSLTLNVQQTLSDLAEGTGGFLVANANEFGKAVDRLAADIRGYYEIQYSPAVVSFDGGFRSIGVKVSRKDVVLQSR
jgi:VWFA-related protein